MVVGSTVCKASVSLYRQLSDLRPRAHPGRRGEGDWCVNCEDGVVTLWACLVVRLLLFSGFFFVSTGDPLFGETDVRGGVLFGGCRSGAVV